MSAAREQLVAALMEERFGPLDSLAVERHLPVPSYRFGACASGPTAQWMAVENARRDVALRGAA